MHEVSLMEQTLAIAVEQARQHRASCIHRLTLNVGQQSGVVPEALAFAFDVVSQGTIAEGAVLTLIDIPVTCRCDQCHANFRPSDWVYICPHCHQISQTIIDGKQLELASLEMS
ncbi:MAG: hydrogenase expression/formation protein HypA [Cyanobacteriota bacterium]|jgi:hydrogenase nickel incorporation protein HypA/HybF